MKEKSIEIYIPPPHPTLLAESTNQHQVLDFTDWDRRQAANCCRQYFSKSLILNKKGVDENE